MTRWCKHGFQIEMCAHCMGPPPGLDSGAALVAKGLAPLSPAGKLQVIMELMGGPPTRCVCEVCGDEHWIEHPALISKEDGLNLLDKP